MSGSFKLIPSGFSVAIKKFNLIFFNSGTEDSFDASSNDIYDLSYKLLQESSTSRTGKVA